MSYEITDLICTCQEYTGFCGCSIESYTEQELENMQLQKMEDKELVEELHYLMSQIAARCGQFVAIKAGQVLTRDMIKADLIAHLDRFEAISQEMERRYIP